MAAKKKQATEAEKPSTEVVVKEEKVVPPVMTFDMTRWNDELAKLEPLAIDIIVSAVEQRAPAVVLGIKAKRILDEAEQVRTNTVKPVNDAVKRVNAAFGFVTDRAKSIIGIIKPKILRFDELENIKQKEAELKAAKAASKGKYSAPPPPPMSSKIVGKEGKGQVKDHWTFEVLDKKKIPMDYLIADEKSIGVAVRSGVRSIPGVRIYNDPNLSLG